MGDAGNDQLMRDRHGHAQFGGDLTQPRTPEPMHFNGDPHALGQFGKSRLQPGQFIPRKDDLLRRGLVGGQTLEGDLTIRSENFAVPARPPQPIYRQIADNPGKIAAGTRQLLFSGHLAKSHIGFLHHVFRMITIACDATRIADEVSALLFKLLVLKPGPPHINRLARSDLPPGRRLTDTRDKLRMVCNQ